MASRDPPKDFDRLREVFQHRFERLSPHLKRIAQYALGDPGRFALQTVAETARETGVQPSTLIRFAKVFGFSGFSEMQQVFRLRLIEGAPSFRTRFTSIAESWRRRPRTTRRPSCTGSPTRPPWLSIISRRTSTPTRCARRSA